MAIKSLSIRIDDAVLDKLHIEEGFLDMFTHQLNIISVVII